MAELAADQSFPFSVTHVTASSTPAWVLDCIDPEGEIEAAASIGDGGMIWRELAGRGQRFLHAEVPDAVDLAPLAFQRRVAEVYEAVRRKLGDGPCNQPVRFWNFVPGIHRSVAHGMDRYEVFNAGRFAAYARWYGTCDFDGRLTAASAVDHRQRSLVIQVLAAERFGRAIENPRQRAAYRYSRRYGPMPPCFARATVAGAPLVRRGCETLIVAGTASVLGEDSAHVDDLAAQVEETRLNLGSLIAESIGMDGVDPVRIHRHRDGLRQALGRIEHLRAYVVDTARAQEVLARLTQDMSALQTVELMPADLCRTNLLVEVEAVALGPPQEPSD